MVQEGFASAAHAAAEDVRPLSEEGARALLQQWPLDAVFRCAQLMVSTPLHVARSL